MPPLPRTMYCSLALLYLSNNTGKLSFQALSSIASPTKTPKPSNPIIVNYLINNLGFSESQAQSRSSHFPSIKTLEKPTSVILFLNQIGFSHSQIRSCALASPQILLLNPEKNLKPKIDYFQDLGLSGHDLGNVFSKNPTLLTCSLSNKLVPAIEIVKRVLKDDGNVENLARVLMRCSRGISGNIQRILNNVSYLESCGIVGSQLSLLVIRQPRILALQESALKALVSKLFDMGFQVDSRMLVHALHTVSCLSTETFKRKMKFVQSFGFTEEESMEMFRKAPSAFRASEGKLKLVIDFFMKTLKCDKNVLVGRPRFFMYSMEARMIPRYEVFKLLSSKGLLKKRQCFSTLLAMSEEEFMKKFIWRFGDDVDELLAIYKGHMFNSPEK
ncbi:Transcription termination factor, mitochondrial/chloroplastic [Dillenia turbinata]|uniref:Transcription termination factor, mitochondrial/chloroplastic n=1 Tax=Dillenia turbinata TaxID=194707 RepID=A0AAN8Z726_9MAGN